MKNNKINLSFPRFVVGNLPLSMLLLKEGQQPCFNKKVEDPRQKPSGMTLCFMGFTLIELLVVVLIIGVLAAVALPQYKIAVAKSRMTQLQIRFNAIEKAVQIYFMANNTFPNDVRDLDIDIEEQGAQYAHLSSLTRDESAKGLVYLNGDQCGTVLFRGKARLICSNRDLAIRNDYINYPTITARYCAAWTAQGEKICKSLSKNQTIDTTYDSGFHQYVLD